MVIAYKAAGAAGLALAGGIRRLPGLAAKDVVSVGNAGDGAGVDLGAVAFDEVDGDVRTFLTKIEFRVTVLIYRVVQLNFRIADRYDHNTFFVGLQIVFVQ